MSTPAEIDAEASRWLAAHDARVATPEERAEFELWLDADIRHRVAYLRLKASWARADGLGGLRPLDRDVDADLLKTRRVWRRTTPLAIAAGTLFVAFAIALLWSTQQMAWQRHETRVGGFSRIVLEDGSVVDLNTDSEIRVRVDGSRRDVQLLRGEGRFRVAHDAARPFEVSAGGLAVRAIGTAFSVRLRESEQVDVLVTQGKVAVDSPHHPGSPTLLAGDVARVAGGHVSVERFAPDVLDRRLAWTSGQLQFRGESLAEAVAEFNRYNNRRLELADSALATLRVGGNFDATDPESFAAAVEKAFNLRVVSSDTAVIVLQPP